MCSELRFFQWLPQHHSNLKLDFQSISFHFRGQTALNLEAKNIIAEPNPETDIFEVLSCLQLWLLVYNIESGCQELGSRGEAMSVTQGQEFKGHKTDWWEKASCFHSNMALP